MAFCGDAPISLACVSVQNRFGIRIRGSPLSILIFRVPSWHLGLGLFHVLFFALYHGKRELLLLSVQCPQVAAVCVLCNVMFLAVKGEGHSSGRLTSYPNTVPLLIFIL